MIYDGFCSACETTISGNSQADLPLFQWHCPLVPRINIKDVHCSLSAITSCHNVCFPMFSAIEEVQGEISSHFIAVGESGNNEGMTTELLISGKRNQNRT